MAVEGDGRGSDPAPETGGDHAQPDEPAERLSEQPADASTGVRDVPEGMASSSPGGWLRRLRHRPPVAPLRRAVTVVRSRRPRRPVQVGIPTLDEMLAGVRVPEPEEDGPATTAQQRDDEEAREQADDSRYGHPGRAFNRNHPFYIGFMGALGVLIAYGLVQLLGALTQVVTLLVVSLFLALGLEPAVEWLQNHGLPRAVAILGVFAVVVALVAGFMSAVVPIVVTQATQLVAELPGFITDIQNSRWFTELDRRYDVVGRITAEVQGFVSGDRVSLLFGGVLGAGKAVLSGVFSILTVLVLTLYLLASMRSIKTTAYGLVPRSRRQRVQLLGDEISRRIGGYVIGQISIASINAVCSFVMMLIVGLPYALVLAVLVGLFGLIPLVGATIGAVVVVIVALFTSLPDAVIVAIYYVAYQQFENYVIAPRIMQRTVAVPGAVALVAALAGGSLFGILGALIAIPLAAGVLLVVQEVVMPRQNRA